MQKLKVSIEIYPQDNEFKNIMDAELNTIGWVCNNDIIYSFEFGLDQSSFQKYGELMQTINTLSAQTDKTIYLDLITTKAQWN